MTVLPAYLDVSEGSPDAQVSARRLYRYMLTNPGAHDRDRIMHFTGFPDPKRHPVIAYVEFHNAVDRVNRSMNGHAVIVGGVETGERYKLEVRQ